MLTERQLRAWNELELGPAWLRRAAVQTPGEAPSPVASTLEADSAQRWSQIRDEVSGCRKCGLCETRRSTVFGSGPQDARWMLIGEAPGAEEDDGAWTPGDAWHDALRVLEVIAGIALIVLAVALPLALVAALAAIALRILRRRRREHALDAV